MIRKLLSQIAVILVIIIVSGCTGGSSHSDNPVIPSEIKFSESTGMEKSTSGILGVYDVEKGGQTLFYVNLLQFYHFL